MDICAKSRHNNIPNGRGSYTSPERGRQSVKLGSGVTRATIYTVYDLYAVHIVGHWRLARKAGVAEA